MSQHTSRIIEAMNSCDWPGVCAIADESADDPLVIHYRVLKASVLFRKRQMQSGVALAAVRTSLDAPPEEPDLFAAVLCSSIGILLDAGELKEAQRVADLADRVRASVKSPELNARILMSLGNLQYAKGQVEDTLRLLEEALQLGMAPGCPMWSQLKALHAHRATSFGKYDAAQRDLEELESFPDLDKYLPAPVAYLRASLCYELGRHEQGLALLDSIPADAQANRAWILHLKCGMLLKIARTAQAGKLIDELEHDNLLPTATLQQLRAQESLAMRDMDGARYHAKLVLASADPIHRSVNNWATTVLVETELAAGRAKAARRLLVQLDPDESRLERSLQWARLHLLEGDDARAAGHFRKLIEYSRLETIEDRLRWAWELSPFQLARLWRLAHEQANMPASDTVIKAGPPASPNAEAEQKNLVGHSAAMVEVQRRIAQFAPLDAPVLITGETGTGKEVVAQLLHRNSRRADEPFMAINCGAMSDSLIESELFGHIKGAFTGAMRDNEGLFVAAGRGTLLLDEIHAMSPRLQASLLRVLENREVRPVGSTDVRKVYARVIAATNESMAELVERKAFRMDLYFRLARLHIDVPPLRQRVEDIPLLVKHFLGIFRGVGSVAAGEDLLAAMKRYDWPGNVRQLKHEIERIVLLSGDSQVLNASLFTTGPRLQSTSSSPRHAAAGAEPALQRAYDVEPVRQLHKRHLRLRELFDQHGRLTRADVIQFFKCSPNTATADLKALEEEGFIRRVRTSGNLRTSYFERVK